MNNQFDFLCDTILHVSEVNENLETVASELRKRGAAHDRTKFTAIEFDAFVSTRSDFKKANYGTREYQECVDKVSHAVEHHHANNRHHTGFHKNGINDMTLIDIVEMLADWKAAERRSPDRELHDTIDYALKKYGVGDQLGSVIKNTLLSLGWMKDCRIDFAENTTHGC